MTNRSRVAARVMAEERAVGRAARVGRVLDAIDHRAYIFYALPSVVVLALLYIAPILANVYLSLHHWQLSRTRPLVWAGLSNFVALLRSKRFHGAVLNTLEYTVLVVVSELVLGMVMALILNRRFVGRGIVRTIFLFPMMATPIAVMLAWRLILDPFAGIFSVIKALGGPRILPPLASETWVIPTLSVVDIWQWTPLVGLILLGGLSALPQEPYEAAMIDGASAWQQFWYITVPLLRPVIGVATLFRTIGALKGFEAVFVLTAGGPLFASETLNFLSFMEAFEYFHTGYASALVLVFFAIIMIFSAGLIRARGAGS